MKLDEMSAEEFLLIHCLTVSIPYFSLSTIHLC